MDNLSVLELWLIVFALAVLYLWVGLFERKGNMGLTLKKLVEEEERLIELVKYCDESLEAVRKLIANTPPDLESQEKESL